MRLTIEGYGETVLDRQLMRFEERLRDPGPIWDQVGTVLREIVELQFESEGAHASGGWPKLAESTVARKAALGQRPEILRATDRLMESLTRKFDHDHIERASVDSLHFGSKVLYGIYHQSSLPRTRLPFRPPIALTESDKRRIVKLVQTTMREEIMA